MDAHGVVLGQPDRLVPRIGPQQDERAGHVVGAERTGAQVDAPLREATEVFPVRGTVFVATGVVVGVGVGDREQCHGDDILFCVGTFETVRRVGCRVGRPAAPGVQFFFPVATLAPALRRFLRRIFPDADFGTVSMNSTWRTFLCGATRSATYAITSSAVICAPCCLTTNALGTSSPSSSSTPITAASAICGWVSSSASSSAGAT